MTDGYYSFDETDALLETLSGSSLPTLSPFENTSSSSTKSSYYGDSPVESNFLQEDWDLKQFEDEEFPKFDSSNNEQNGDIYSNDNFINDGNAQQDVQQFVSPSSVNVSLSVPFAQNNIIKSESNPSRDEEFADGDVSSLNSDKDETDFSSNKAAHIKSTIATATSSKNKVTKPKKDRSSHTVIEKKYRTNINTKISALRDAVPALRAASGDKETNIDDLEGLSLPSKVNKATIFTKATEYIQHLENKNDRLTEENQQLKQLLSSYQSQPQNLNYNRSPVQQQPQQPQTQQQSSIPTRPIQPQASSLSQFQPATDYNGNPLNVVNQSQPNYQVGLPGKILMGGLTVMAGQTMFNGNGNSFDQYGLSAFPILGAPQFAAVVHVVKVLTIFTSLVYIFVPSLFTKGGFGKDTTTANEKKIKQGVKRAEWYELIKQLVFIHTGDSEKIEISEADASALINKTLLNVDGESVAISRHVLLLLKLHTFKTNFEVSFGKIVLSKLLLSYSNLFQSIFFINSKLNSIIDENLNEISKNLKINETNLRYFFKEFNKSSVSFQNSECFRRLLNISLNLDFDLNCHKGLSDKGYQMILRDEQVTGDYKSVLISLRANELFREVLLEFINLTFNDKFISELTNDELKQLKTELWNKLTFCENLSPKNSGIDIRIKLFKSVCNEKYVDMILKRISDETEEVKSDIMEGEEYSDFEEEEEVDEDDNDDKEGSTNDTESSKSIRKPTPKFQKILSQDLFNSLVCSTILKSTSSGQKSEALKLFNYLKLQNKDEISLLSFVSMFKVIEKFPKDWTSEVNGSSSSDKRFQAILNQVISSLRLWIGDVNNVNFRDLENEGIQFKREISDKLVSVSKKFNEY